MIWDIIWVTVVALCSVALVAMGLRRSRGALAIAAGALLWAFARWAWIDFSWFLVRPLGGGWVLLVFVLFLLSVAVIFWRRSSRSWPGWVALFFAVLAPFWDLFTAELWGDIWPDGLPGSTAFWVIAVILLVAGVVLWLFVRGLAIGLLVAAVAIGLLNLGWGLTFSDRESDKDGPKAEPSATATPSASPSSSPTADPVECEFGPATFTENKSYRMLVDGLARSDAQKAKRQAMRLATHNTVFVSGMAMERKLNGGGYIDARQLSKDGCWTEEGHELSIKVQGIVEVAKTSYGIVGPDAINTGGRDGQLVMERGVRGDRRALVLTHADGTTTKILLRCSNVTFETPPPGVPEGPTDNPPKKPKKPKPPKLQPKSSNPADYKVEQGAPKAEAEGKATQPSPVKTESTGGRGVKDSPANQPGSETGVQAPGADPAPTTTPSPPEAGANDPSGGGNTCVPPPGMTTC